MPSILRQTITDPFTGETAEYVSPDWSVEIARGIEFLDRVSPGWESKINPLTLQLDNTEVCVCGQVFSGHYDEGMQRLAQELNPNDFDVVYFAQSSDYAFNFPSVLGAEDLGSHVDAGSVTSEWSLGYSLAAYELDKWAREYLQSHDPKFVDDYIETQEMQVDALLWSALTEQWIAAIISRRKARSLQDSAAE